MGPIFNNLFLNRTLFPSFFFPSLSTWLFFPRFFSLPSLLSLFCLFFLLFFLFIFCYLWKRTYFISKNQRELWWDRDDSVTKATASQQRHPGDGKEAKTSLVSFSFSLSLCLSLSLADRSRSLLSLSWRRWRQEVVVIIFADLSDLCHFFSLDNEVRNFMDND